MESSTPLLQSPVAEAICSFLAGRGSFGSLAGLACVARVFGAFAAPYLRLARTERLGMVLGALCLLGPLLRSLSVDTFRIVLTGNHLEVCSDLLTDRARKELLRAHDARESPFVCDLLPSHAIGRSPGDPRQFIAINKGYLTRLLGLVVPAPRVVLLGPRKPLRHSARPGEMFGPGGTPGLDWAHVANQKMLGALLAVAAAGRPRRLTVWDLLIEARRAIQSRPELRLGDFSCRSEDDGVLILGAEIIRNGDLRRSRAPRFPYRELRRLFGELE